MATLPVDLLKIIDGYGPHLSVGTGVRQARASRIEQHLLEVACLDLPARLTAF
jgi:hypothetical protein